MSRSALVPKGTLTVEPVRGLPGVRPGDDLAGLLVAALEPSRPRAGDILVVAQKIVSKAEGRFLDLDSCEPSARALELSKVTGKDPRLVEAILSQTGEVIRAAPHVLIVATVQGIVLANAGIDQSNLESEDHGRRVLLLPENPDHSAEQLRMRLAARFGESIGIIIADSVGRPWRLGTVGIAIGAAGVPSLWDRRGESDRSGRRLEVTEVAVADSVAAIGVLVMGEGAEDVPAALVRGFECPAAELPAAALQRSRSADLFR